MKSRPSGDLLLYAGQHLGKKPGVHDTLERHLWAVEWHERAAGLLFGYHLGRLAGGAR